MTIVRMYLPKASVSAETSARAGRPSARPRAARRAAAAAGLRRLGMFPPDALDVAVELLHLGKAALDQRAQVAQPAERDLLARVVAFLAGELPAAEGIQEQDVVVGLVGARGERVGL